MDALSSAPHYRAHLLPLWEALPPELRGNRLDIDTGHGRHTDGSRSVLVASARDMGHAWRLGYRRIAYVEHGIGQPYTGLQSPSYPGGPGREKIGLFLSPNETAAARDRAAYPKARVEVIGDPTLDALPRRIAGPAVVALSFHWDWSRIPELQSSAAHYLPVLPAIAAEFTVLGHGHPRMIDRLELSYRRAGIEVVRSFHEVCRRASVYVCDNSSTLYEFAATDRPVVLLNAPWYRRDVEHGLRFWEAAGIGRQVDHPDDLAEAIRCSLSEPVPSSAAAALQLAYSATTGAAERGAAILAGWA